MFLVKCRRWFEENDSKRNETTLDSEIHRICTKNTTFYSETNVWISDHILYMKISNIFFRLKKRNVFDETSWRFKQISNNCRFIILGLIYIIMINRDVYGVWGSVSSPFTKIAKCVTRLCHALCQICYNREYVQGIKYIHFEKRWMNSDNADMGPTFDAGKDFLSSVVGINRNVQWKTLPLDEKICPVAGNRWTWWCFAW